MARLDVWSYMLLSLLYGRVSEACPDRCGCRPAAVYICNGIRVNCSSKGLTTVPTNISKDTCILNLYRNQITALEKGTFEGLENLQELNLDNNQITALAKGAFEGLENLQELYLDDNQITALEKGTFEGMENLQVLSLSSNQITGLAKGAFEGLENLQELNLNGNQITALTKETIEGLENLHLHYLILSKNQLTALEKGAFKGFQKLKGLALHDNQITALAKGTFEGLENLQALIIDENPLHCNCQMVVFMSFATSKSLRLKWRTEPRCRSPDNLNGTLLKDLPLRIQEMDCQLNSTTTARSTGIDVVSTTALTYDNSTEIMERSDIVCNADSIEVFLPVQFFSVPSRVTWLDPNCSITSNSTHYVSTIKHGQCGTTVSLTKDNVIFENEIKASVLTTQNIFVNFGKPFVIPVKCIYPRKEMTLSSYQPLKQQVRVYEKRFGHLDIDMRQYETNQFRHALEESNYPRKHILNSDIFFKVTLQNNGAAELGIRLDTCIATKTSSPYDNVFIKLIENGCPKVNFVHLLPSPVNETRFSLSAFEFTSSQSNVVYIHCQASVCLAASQCTSDCTASGRTKRDLSSEPSHLLSMGPLMFVSDKVYASNLVANAIAGVSATIAMVAIVVAVMGWRRKTKGNVKDNQLY